VVFPLTYFGELQIETCNSVHDRVKKQ